MQVAASRCTRGRYRQPDVKGECQDGLLSGVVQVALEAASLDIAGLYNPYLGVFELRQLVQQLGLKSLVVDRHSRCWTNRLHQSARVHKRGVVVDDGYRLAVPNDLGDRSPAVASGNWNLLAEPVHEPVRFRQPIGDLQRGVSGGASENWCQRSRLRGSTELLGEVPQRSPCPSGAQHTARRPGGQRSD